VGEVLAQKYRVESVVGAGGMGVVVSARHLQLGQVVAIKLLTLPPDEDRREEAIARFLHEAQAAAKLQSDHVVRIYDVGQLDNGLPFMVMELLSGIDLGTLLDESGPLPEAQAIDLLLQACAGVAEAHRMGIVHRDLKPSNLFVTTRSDGLALLKVLDFGISKQLTDPASGEAVPTFTNTRTLMGSPNYMSPEQIRDARRVDGRTDVWALGIILQELLTDAPVFRGESFPGICAAIVADPPMPLRTTRPDVTPALEQVIDRCLKKDPQQRFQSIAELVSALSSVGTRTPLSSAAGKPIVYSAQPRIVTSTGSVMDRPAPLLSRVDAVTVSSNPPPDGTRSDATLESARLSGGLKPTPSSADSDVQVVKPRSSRHWRWVLAGWLAACAVLLWFWLSRSPTASESPTSASGAPSAIAAPVPATFTLGIDSEPLGAMVSENGKLLGSTPLSLTLAQDSTTRVLILEKPGYEPYVLRQAAARGEVHVRAALVPRPEPSPKGSVAAEPSAAPRKQPLPAVKRAPAKRPAPSAAPAPSDIRLER
jgi:serine/threonine-protein kinase